jgi:peptidoglycan hydrolase-like protein with peptidoglycan-binding domain
MSPGPDVAALNTNLNALGYGKDLGGDIFTAATEAAVKAFQSADHMPATGQIALGSVLFEPGTVEVNSVAPTLGSSPSGGQAVLQVTLTARQVQIALDASQQSDVAVGDAVSIVMPDNSTTPGVVSYVGTIATTPSSQNGGSGTPTINVNVTPLDPAATGNLDDLPVNVWITEASVPTALVVQVDALVALSGGGYALEVAPAHGAHYLEAVSLGLFDDADGLVQVTGAGVQAGQRIVVPQV